MIQSLAAIYGTSRRADPDVAVHVGAAPGASAGNAAFTMIEMDVDDGPLVERGVDQILISVGRLDVVVNNAGIPLADRGY